MNSRVRDLLAQYGISVDPMTVYVQNLMIIRSFGANPTVLMNDAVELYS